jgi:hypothetical protein
MLNVSGTYGKRDDEVMRGNWGKRASLSRRCKI